MLCQVFLPEYQIVPGFNKALSESRTAMSGQVFAGNKWGVSSSGLTGTGAQLCATLQPRESHWNSAFQIKKLIGRWMTLVLPWIKKMQKSNDWVYTGQTEDIAGKIREICGELI